MIRGRGRRLRLGQSGEHEAAKWLRRRGYRILRRNLRLGRREIDLVAETPDGRVVIVVEVKSGESLLQASGRVDARKKHHVAFVASALVRNGIAEDGMCNPLKIFPQLQSNRQPDSRFGTGPDATLRLY